MEGEIKLALWWVKINAIRIWKSKVASCLKQNEPNKWKILNQIFFCILGHPVSIHIVTMSYQIQKPVSSMNWTADSLLVKQFLQALSLKLSGNFYLSWIELLKFWFKKRLLTIISIWRFLGSVKTSKVNFSFGKCIIPGTEFILIFSIFQIDNFCSHKNAAYFLGRKL